MNDKLLLSAIGVALALTGCALPPVSLDPSASAIEVSKGEPDLNQCEYLAQVQGIARVNWNRPGSNPYASATNDILNNAALLGATTVKIDTERTSVRGLQDGYREVVLDGRAFKCK